MISLGILAYQSAQEPTLMAKFWEHNLKRTILIVAEEHRKPHQNYFLNAMPEKRNTTNLSREKGECPVKPSRLVKLKREPPPHFLLLRWLWLWLALLPMALEPSVDFEGVARIRHGRVAVASSDIFRWRTGVGVSVWIGCDSTEIDTFFLLEFG